MFLLVSCVDPWRVPGLFLYCSRCFSLILHFGAQFPHPIDAIPVPDVPSSRYLPNGEAPEPLPRTRTTLGLFPSSLRSLLKVFGGREVGGLDLRWTEALPPPSHWSPLPRVLTCKCFLSPVPLSPSISLPFPFQADLKWSSLPHGASPSMPVLHTLPFSRVLRNWDLPWRCRSLDSASPSL